MGICINRLLLNVDDETVEMPLKDIGTDDEEFERMTRNITFEWQKPALFVSGRKRYLALCKAMGLTPKEPPHE